MASTVSASSSSTSTSHTATAADDGLEQPLLFFNFTPQDARPPQDAIVHALRECTRFRLHQAPDSSQNAPRFTSVEFENLDKAKKARALLKNLSLPRTDPPITVTLTAEENASLPVRPPKGSKTLNVSELPPGYTAGQVYDLFVVHGPIFSVEPTAFQGARVTFYNGQDADNARNELNYSAVDGYQIIVRVPSKSDRNDFFRTSRHGPGHRSFSAGVPSLSQSSHDKPMTGRSVSHSHDGPPTTVRVERPHSRPLRIFDPTRIIVQNIPLDLTAEDLYRAFAFFGEIQEANLACDPQSGKSTGNGSVRYEEPQEAQRAIKEMHGKYIKHVGKVEKPLIVLPFENTKSKLAFGPNAVEQKKSLGLNLDAPPFVPLASSPTGAVAAMADSVEDLSISKAPENQPANLSPEQILKNKHRKVLLIAVEETGADDAEKLVDILLELEEDQRKRCIVDDEYLLRKIQAAREIRSKEEDGSTSPTRLRSRRSMLALYSPKATKSEKLEDVAASVTKSFHKSPKQNRRELSPTVPSVTRGEADNTVNPWSSEPVRKVDDTQPEQRQMDMDTLVRFSIKGIMDLAEGPNPPTALSRRDEHIVKQVDELLASYSGLKLSLQKQKIGEKVFKVFKTNAQGMKNISKRTVALLDQEDLPALLHLCEEFPEVLVAKANAMSM